MTKQRRDIKKHRVNSLPKLSETAWYKNSEFTEKKRQIVLTSSSEELSTPGCLRSQSFSPAKMASGWNCYTSCPPMTVTIQPPPYTLNIPGPSIYCADQSVCIEQCNPCAAFPPSGIINHGGYGLLPAGSASDFSCSSLKSLESDYYF
ncbi:hypothetical protein Chor_005041 [Crotalus horridus]